MIVSGDAKLIRSALNTLASTKNPPSRFLSLQLKKSFGKAEQMCYLIGKVKQAHEVNILLKRSLVQTSRFTLFSMT